MDLKLIKQREGNEGVRGSNKLMFYMVKNCSVGTKQQRHLEDTGDVFATLVILFGRALTWRHKPSWFAKRYALKPDAHALIEFPNGNVSLFIEIDAGTEPIGTVAKKMAAYEQYYQDTGDTFYVLSVFDNRSERSNEASRTNSFLERMKEKHYNPFRYLACTMSAFRSLAVENRPILFTHTGHKLSIDRLHRQHS